jgi:hypothetical protein
MPFFFMVLLFRFFLRPGQLRIDFLSNYWVRINRAAHIGSKIIKNRLVVALGRAAIAKAWIFAAGVDSWNRRPMSFRGLT